ncbi:MAG: YdcF family protein [Chitinophagaceae bacterium]|nr:YdcF family protein [Chitinophagaceae bacterium]
MSNIPHAHVGLILGAGIKNQSPSVYLKDRLDKGIELYKLKKVDQLLISGDNGNDKDDEITVMKNYLLSNGIPLNKILIDTAGYDTYSSMYRVKNIFHLDTIIVITQNYHLDRAVFIGRKLHLNCYGLMADKSKYKKYNYYAAREYLSICKACWDLFTNRKIE